MKTWVLNHKKISILVVLVLLSAWFFGYFMPKQDCLDKITLVGDQYKTSYSSFDRFKTRNDALDYCMAQRWNF